MARQIAVAGQAATASIEEENCTNLRTGKPFRAKIVPIEDKSLNTELGLDSRASDFFHVLDPNVNMLPGDKVSALGETFVILPAGTPNNAASLHLKFTVMQLTDKDS